MFLYIYLLKCFRTYRHLHRHEAGPFLRWKGAHTDRLHSGVLSAGRATSSGGSGRPDGLITPQSQPYHLTLLSDRQRLLPLAGSPFHAFDNDSGLKYVCFFFFLLVAWVIIFCMEWIANGGEAAGLPPPWCKRHGWGMVMFLPLVARHFFDLFLIKMAVGLWGHMDATRH